MTRLLMRISVIFISTSAMFMAETVHAEHVSTVPPTMPALVGSTMDRPNLDVVAPPLTAHYKVPNAVILKGDSTASTIKTARVVRRYSFATVRSNPKIPLGLAKADLTPVFNNPASLSNVAARLKAMPTVAVVTSEVPDIFEIPEGLVIRQVMSYHLKPGVCANPGQRTQIERAGISCVKRMTVQNRTAALADTTSRRYIADPARRAKAAAFAESTAKAQLAEINSGIMEFRAALNDPAKRARMDAEYGAGEVARLAALDNDALGSEFVNSSENTIEQVLFIPKLDKLDFQANAAQNKNAPVPDKGLVHIPPPSQNLHASMPIDEKIFLTGFTLGKEHEFSQGVRKTINYVVKKKTYYAEAYARFGYGFGLRFPIKVGGTYTYTKTNNAEDANVTVNIAPINGNVADYASTGLPADKNFEGKELVAEVGATAGFRWKLPILGSDDWSVPVKVDFTDYLTGDFHDGQFRPPSPKDPNPPETRLFFRQLDLLGNLANFGVAGAQVYPGVHVTLLSDDLHFTFRDNYAGGNPRPLTVGGAPIPLKFGPGSTNDFTILNPEYSLHFNLEPGVQVALWVDVAVWSHEWAWDIWFPALAIELPPGGLEFFCHEGTICGYNYAYSPTGGQVQERPSDPYKAAIADGEHKIKIWKMQFLEEWQPQCVKLPLDFCKAGINSVAANYANILANSMHHQLDSAANKQPNINNLYNFWSTQLFDADTRAAKGKARDIVLEVVRAKIGNWQRDFNKEWPPGTCPPEKGNGHSCQSDLLDLVHGWADDTTRDMTAVLSNKNGGKTADGIFSANAVRASKQARAIMLKYDMLYLKAQGQETAESEVATWSKQCHDDVCRTGIAFLSDQYVETLIARQKADLQVPAIKVIADEKREGNWPAKFQQLVAASKERSSAAGSPMRNQRGGTMQLPSRSNQQPSGGSKTTEQPPDTSSSPSSGKTRLNRMIRIAPQ